MTIYQRANSILPFVAMVTGLIMSMSLSAGVAFGQSADDDDETVIGTPELTESEARDRAETFYRGSGDFSDIELEMEGDTLVYAIEFVEDDGNQVDVKIDAETGALVTIEDDRSDASDDMNDEDTKVTGTTTDQNNERNISITLNDEMYNSIKLLLERIIVLLQTLSAR